MVPHTPKNSEIAFAVRFGEFVRTRREALGFKQNKTAEMAFGSKSDQRQLSKIERGVRKTITAQTIRALADVLDIQEWELSLLRAGYSHNEINTWQSGGSSAPKPIEHLQSRAAFIARAAKLLKSTNTFRAMLTGPFFCHPDSYFAAKATGLQYPDLDKLQKKFILSQTERSYSIRLIVSNSDRYLKKVRSYIPVTELKSFFEACLASVEEIWGADFSKGPDICCARLGYIHIPYIFDEAVLVQHRKDQMTPTGGGDCITSSEIVEMERNRFDSIFENNSDGQRKEIQKLKNFLFSQAKRL